MVAEQGLERRQETLIIFRGMNKLSLAYLLEHSLGLDIRASDNVAQSSKNWGEKENIRNRVQHLNQLDSDSTLKVI